MSEKKNIDRLFQEKFKDFEAAPPEFVWDNLEEILQEKKKRRVVPLWWRMGGIAAALVVGMLFLYPFFTANTPDGTDNGKGVVYGNDNQNQPGTKGNNNPAGNTGNEGKGILVPNPAIKSQGPASPVVATDRQKVVEEQNSKSQNPAGKFQNTGSKKQTREAYAGTKSQIKNPKSKNTGVGNQPVKGAIQRPAHNAQPESGIANNAQQANEVKPQRATSNAQFPTQTPQQETGVANNTKQDNQDNGVKTQPEQNNPQLPIPNPEQAVAEAPVDSLQKPENELDKLLREQKEQKEALAKNDKGEGNTKWDVKPQLGPLLYNSMTGGSPIDGQFASNSKSFDNQMSYGVGVNYALTNRLTVRSGVNTVNLSYATEGVQFYASLSEGTSNVARASSANIVVQNGQPAPIVPTNSFMNSDQLPKETFNGSMVQSTGYIEVPLEMSYALVDKKFSIDVIGGFSTLFLNDNNVSVVSSQGLSTDVGRAQNLNDISFSTNLGLGFKYRFFKQFKASFEPTFKYQVNPYTRDSGNFRPYFIGLYTGISFSF